LIAPNLVVTALHCLSDLTGDGSFLCNNDGTLANPPNGLLGQPFDPAAVEVTVGRTFTQEVAAVGQRILSTRATDICKEDLAFMVLDRELQGVAIAPMRLDNPVERYEELSVVGYGLPTNPAEVPPGYEAQRLRRDDVAVEAVGRRNGQAEGTYYARPGTFSLGESVCMGDSGGPALSDQGAVVGVYSTNSVSCTGSTARNFFTMLSEFKPLALQAYEAAGATPWLERQKRPGVWPDAGIAPPQAPEPSIDAGNLQTLDSNAPLTPEEPRVTQRVDSGFCAVRPDSTPTKGAPLALALAGVVLALRRRKSVA
jgi:MYXO-CTERM domain-containing protein